jgi:hypothetical protein
LFQNHLFRENLFQHPPIIAILISDIGNSLIKVLLVVQERKIDCQLPQLAAISHNKNFGLYPISQQKIGRDRIESVISISRDRNKSSFAA